MNTQTDAQATQNTETRITPYGLTDEQYNTLQGVADTLFMLSDNQNPNGDIQALKMSNCLDLLWQQMNGVLGDGKKLTSD